MFGPKAYPFLVLNVLKEYSDAQNPLTQKEIINKIYENYNVLIERKAISSSICLLNELGYEIERCPNDKQGFALTEREFEPSELTFLTSAVFASKSLPSNYAKNLVDKLLNCLSKKYRENYNTFIYKCNEVDRTNDKDFFYNIEVISKAIRNNNKITFNYMTINDDGNKAMRLDDNNKPKTYVVSPYYLINSRGFCYLISIHDSSANEERNDVSIFRIDYIKDPKILGAKVREKITSIKKYEKGFNVAQFMNDHIYMFGTDNPIEVKLKINDKNGAKYVKEWFGHHSKIYKDGTATYANVRADESTFFFWIMQYSEHFTLLEPKSLIQKVRKAAKNILDTYK